MTSKNRLLTYVLSKLTQSEMNVIQGEQVGLANMLEDFNIGYYARKYHLGHSADGLGEEMVEVQHKSTLFMLMMSKDDNLMLQMGGLISTLADSSFLTPELKDMVPELFTLASQDHS